MCFDCREGGVPRRQFLAGAAAVALSTAALRAAPDDPDVAGEEVTFPNGPDKIRGYLARPKGEGAYPAVVLLHGNPGLPAWLKDTAARLARGGVVGLVVDLNSRAADPDKPDKPLEYYRTNAFARQVASDALAGLAHLKARPFVRGGSLGMVGFCGGGRAALALAAESREVRAVVCFYGPVRFQQRRPA